MTARRREALFPPWISVPDNGASGRAAGVQLDGRCIDSHAVCRAGCIDSCVAPRLDSLVTREWRESASASSRPSRRHNGARGIARVSRATSVPGTMHARGSRRGIFIYKRRHDMRHGK